VRIAGRVVARHEVSLGAGWVIDLGAAGPR
jgi:hypothetical protein